MQNNKNLANEIGEFRARKSRNGGQIFLKNDDGASNSNGSQTLPKSQNLAYLNQAQIPAPSLDENKVEILSQAPKKSTTNFADGGIRSVRFVRMQTLNLAQRQAVNSPQNLTRGIVLNLLHKNSQNKSDFTFAALQCGFKKLTPKIFAEQTRFSPQKKTLQTATPSRKPQAPINCVKNQNLSRDLVVNLSQNKPYFSLGSLQIRIKKRAFSFAAAQAKIFPQKKSDFVCGLPQAEVRRAKAYKQTQFFARILPRATDTLQKSQTPISRSKIQILPCGVALNLSQNESNLTLNLPQNNFKGRIVADGQVRITRNFRTDATQNRFRILNETRSKNGPENPTQGLKNRANSISLNAAKGSCFTSGANLQPGINQTAPSAADQDALLAEFKAFLSAHLPSNHSFHPCFDEALSYTLKSGGKHFRAMLVAGVVAAVRPERKEAAFHVALAFETMHSYSLIHDDLPAMDDSDLRRGQPSLHVKFDEVTAILAGDALNTHAFYQIARAPLDADARIKCVEILSRNAGIYGMALGQAVDCYFENQKLGLEELKFLHIHKTARLIAASLQAGCVVAGLDETEAARIYDIGLDLGLAFQIADDIIDATQSAETAGKPTHNDGAKNSFTNLLGVEGAVQAKNELIVKIERELGTVHTGIRTIVTGLIDKHLR